MKVELFDYNTEAWVGETISKGMRRHQNARWFNRDRIGHMRWDCIQGIATNNVFSGNGKNRRYQSSGLCGKCGKGQHWTNECRSTKDNQDNMIPSENSLGEPFVGPQVKCDLVVPSHRRGHVSPGGKIHCLLKKKSYCFG